MIVMYSKKHLFTWSNKDKVLIGSVGYFGNSIAELEKNIRLNKSDVLVDVYKSPLDTVNKVFKARDVVTAYGLFIPRQYTNYQGTATPTIRPIENIDEFEKLVCELQERIYVRNREDSKIYCKRVNSFELHKGNLVAVTLDSKSYTLKELFDEFEFKKLDKFTWQRFGVCIL